MPCRSHPRTGPHPAPPLPRAAQLFRASDAAYAPLAAARVVAILAERCADRDGPTRKFAAFAVGNAAFHSSALYAELAAAIPALVHRLRDDDARARANAAGALGNLARNADSLVGELTRHGAPAALLALARSALDEAAGEAADSAPADEERLAPARIALFALGNLATHRAAHAALKELRLDELVSAAEPMGDATYLKYARRVVAKLDGGGEGGR